MPAVQMADPFTLEATDLQIIRALQIDPRVPFATMAAVLGLSEPTVSRRYGRMRRTGVLRVTGVVDPGALGQSQWMVRLRCRPGSGAAIAEALADRDDVGWVALSAAGAEVTCWVRSRSQEEREDLLGHKLPRATAVLDLESSVMLRKFLGGRGHYWAALTGVLTPEQEARLGSAGSPFTESAVVVSRSPHLRDHDERLLAALAADGRASLVDLAAAAGLTPGRASRRLQTLVAERVVHIHVELSPAALGYHARANLWLRVHPSKTKSVGRALAQMPEVGFAAAMSGKDNLHALVRCRDLEELFAFTSDRVGALPGVEAAEVSPIHRQIKQAGTLLSGDRLQEHAKGHRR
ncbi:Lrp/AsnC family transcriptional regulator [Actinoallomurus sp. NBC_01490]|uniref:Lrp/AsnC family transcriptional regulator n=1 Tax=Actinoallomurus sp. NBC_01490 TaxID=2903557 RepID=UPI002E35EA37|nr:Lrp/AsnC family transcriptional regulator [Actinoallomurus sp. NBC_01490]